MATVIDGIRSAQRALAKGTAKKGMCLREVWISAGSPQDIDAPFQNATQARQQAQKNGAIEGHSVYAAPDGAVLFWSNVVVRGVDLGHIAWKYQGKIATIDNPTSGRWGLVTIGQFYRKWSWLRFQGYAYGPGAFLGLEVTTELDLKPVPEVPTDVPYKPPAGALSNGVDVFIAIRKGSFFLAIPVAGGYTLCPLGKNDLTENTPVVRFVEDRGWSTFKSKVTNPIVLNGL